ncbi:hypothetical protein [Magnetospirillum sp. SS-4]|nr:hypothetical protein [Magnetospirillum sp. SS-4]CAA7627565.1 conserved hypothetical protein [Magnetospirillum sp. SS-4]
MASSRRIPAPANDNRHPDGRRRLIVAAAIVLLTLAAMVLGVQTS